MKRFIILSIATLTLIGFGGKAFATSGDGGFCNQISAAVCPSK
jgi:hypothetical protein